MVPQPLDRYRVRPRLVNNATRIGRGPYGGLVPAMRREVGEEVLDARVRVECQLLAGEREGQLRREIGVHAASLTGRPDMETARAEGPSCVAHNNGRAAPSEGLNAVYPPPGDINSQRRSQRLL